MNGMIMTLYDPNVIQMFGMRMVADGCDATFKLSWHQHDYETRFKLSSSIISWLRLFENHMTKIRLQD